MKRTINKFFLDKINKLKKRNLYKWIWLLFIISMSCEKVIVVDLENSEPQIVIDAVITDELKPHIITINKSGDFYNPSIFPSVNGARVIIFDDSGLADTLTELGEGLYQTSLFRGNTNYVYSIDVNAEGERYTGESTMPEAMEIDSITFKLAQRRPRDTGEYYELHVHFRNRPGIPDFARLKIYQNGELLSNYNLFSDQYSDGKNVDYLFFGNMKLELFDTVNVELLSIDESTYDYYSTLAQVIASDDGGGGPVGDVTPANPNTNLSNDALGYFAAYTVRRDSAIVK